MTYERVGIKGTIPTGDRLTHNGISIWAEMDIKFASLLISIDQNCLQFFMRVLVGI